MQGWRTNMEDAHLAQLDFEDGIHFFGVFDGHGGKEVAIYCADNLIDIFKDQVGPDHPMFNDSASSREDDHEFAGALINSFIELDRRLATK